MGEHQETNNSTISQNPAQVREDRNSLPEIGVEDSTKGAHCEQRQEHEFQETPNDGQEEPRSIPDALLSEARADMQDAQQIEKPVESAQADPAAPHVAQTGAVAPATCKSVDERRTGSDTSVNGKVPNPATSTSLYQFFEQESCHAEADRRFPTRLEPTLAKRLAVQQSKCQNGTSAIGTVGSVAERSAARLEPTLDQRLTRQLQKCEGVVEPISTVPSRKQVSQNIPVIDSGLAARLARQRAKLDEVQN